MSRDIDLQGTVLKDYGNVILFEDAETGKRVKLPRDEIAVIQEVKGVTISLPFKLAKVVGLA